MKKKLSSYFWRTFIVVAFVLSFMLQIATTAIDISGRYDINTAKSFHRALAWLRGNSQEQDIVMTTWLLGSQVAALTGRRVIATSKVYPSETREVARRYLDIRAFFNARDEEVAREIADKYGASFTLFQKGHRVSSNTFLSQMNEGEKFINFTLVYDSGMHAIYKKKDMNKSLIRMRR